MAKAATYDLNALAAGLQAAVGKNDTEPEITGWLPLPYAPLNKAISGKYHGRGLPYGRIAEIYGPSAAGKTVIASEAIASAQRLGGIGVFIDWERTFNAQFAGHFGVDAEFPKLVYKRSETWEDGNTVAMQVAEAVRKKKLIDPRAPIVVVQDSVAAAVPASVMETIKKKGIDGLTMNDTTALARVTSTTLKNVNAFVSEYNVVMIYLNQIRTKPGVVYGDPTSTPGGGAMEFYASTRLALGKKNVNEGKGDDKEFIGRDISFKVTKSKVTKPFTTGEMALRYTPEGLAYFDRTTSLLDHLIDNNVLVGGKTPGGDVEWTDGKVYKKTDFCAAIDAKGAYSELEKLLVD